MTKYLDQCCMLCENRPVTYVKTKGGFHKLCDACKSILEREGLAIESEKVHTLPVSPSAGTQLVEILDSSPEDFMERQKIADILGVPVETIHKLDIVEAIPDPPNV